MNSFRFMWSAARFYWVAAKGYRLQPWQSPYLRWRLETFLGPEAEAAHDAGGFFRLLWRERARLARFLIWSEKRRSEQKARREG